MASSHGNPQSEPAKMEQIITEFFAKSLHIILESRCAYLSSRNFSGEQALSSPSSSSSSSSSVRPRDKWFNLALRECPAALENIDFWRQSNYEPMVVDVILVQRPLDWDPVNCSPRLKERSLNCWNSDQEDLSWNLRREKIVERWIVKYESRKSRDISSGSKRSSCASSQTLYKKSILLLRSLYVTVRLLPAYNLFRDLNASSQIGAFTLTHRVSSIAEPFTRSTEAEMQRFGFTPVETSCGRLCLSVLYRSSALDVSSTPSTPMSPQFIPDYVGSPLTDPLKRFPSLPVTGVILHASPSSSPFTRRHSWSYDIHRASPPSLSFSPSPTYSESRATVSNPCSGCLPPTSLPPHPPEKSLSGTKNLLLDECWPSPVFSLSSSVSPPICIPGNQMSKSHCHSGSAPVVIPASRLANNPSLLNKHVLPPPPSRKGSKPRSSEEDKINITVEKLFNFERDEIGKTSGVDIPSNTTPHISFSKGSRRVSFHDDYDSPDFACPFELDDDDMTNEGNRPESSDQKGHLKEPLEPGGRKPIKKSQAAAVGALVHMLKKAPPLRQDLSKTLAPSQASSIMSSGLTASKTASDALDELQSYREMKNLLLSKVGTSNTMVNFGSATES